MTNQWLNEISVPVGVLMLVMFLAVLRRVQIWWGRASELRACIIALQGHPESATAAALRGHMNDIVQSIPWLNEPFYEWWEQTWVASDDSGDRLRNALQSGEFLDADSLEPQDFSIAESFPGLLTALGIFGTFLGIAFGLAGIQLDASDLAAEITPLVQGLKTAFGTSIVGLALSMLSTGLLTYSASRFETARLDLIRWLDAQVDRTTSQDLLRDLIVELRSSNELAEKQLGLQKEVVAGIQGLEHDIGNAMEQSIQRSGLVEAVQNMAAQVAQTQTEGVGQIVDQFSEQLGERFADRFDQLGQSLDGMVQANDQYQAQMSGVVSDLGSAIEGQREAAQQTQLSLQEAKSAASSLQAAAEAAARAATQVSQAGGEAGKLLGQQNEAARTLSGSLDRQRLAVQDLGTTVQSLREWHDRLRDVLDGQLESWNRALGEQRGLTADLADERKTTTQLVAALDRTAGSMQAVQAGLGETTGELRAQLQTSGRAREASVAQLERAGQSLVDLEAKVASSLGAFERTASLLSKNTSAVQASLNALTQAARGQSDIAARTDRMAASLEKSVQAQERLAAGLGSAAAQASSLAELSAGLTQAADGLRGMDKRLADANLAMSEAARQLAQRDKEAERTWSSVTTELRRTTGDLTTGMAEYSRQVNSSVAATAGQFDDFMAKAIGDLSAAAGALSSVAAELQDVADALAEQR